jgi:hypothetical protein
MSNVSAILGTGRASVIIVPKAVEKVGEALELQPVVTAKPSYMMYDLTKGAYDHVLTIADLIQVLAIICTLIFVTIAISGWCEKRRLKRWPDSVVRDPDDD